MVQSLMQQLSSNFNLADLQEGVALDGKDHPLKAPNNSRSDHPLFANSSGVPPRPPSHAHRRSSSAARGSAHHPLMASGGNSLRASRSKHSHRRSSSLPVQHPVLRHDQPLSFSSGPNSPTSQPPVVQELTADDLNFLKMMNDPGVPLQTGSNHSSDNDQNSEFAPPPPAQPPMMEVVTSPQQQLRFDGEMSGDFLSMLHEPIYEFDVEANEDLY